MKTILYILNSAGEWAMRTALRVLRHYYRRYAIFDVVIVGELECVREKRDFVFEGMLEKHKLEIFSTPFRSDIPAEPVERRPFRMKPFYNWFRFADRLYVRRGEESVTIDRSSRLHFYGTLDSTVRVSANSGAVRKTVTVFGKPESASAQAQGHGHADPSTAPEGAGETDGGAASGGDAASTPARHGEDASREGHGALVLDSREIRRERESLSQTIRLVRDHFAKA